MSRFAKNTTLKLLEGNLGKRPISKDEPMPEKGIPPMPSWLEAFPIAVREWQRESKILDDIGILTIADESLLAARAYLSHLIQTLAWDLKREGTVLDTLNGGIRSNPKMGQMQTALSEHRRAGYMLGLDPSSRSRLHTGKPTEDDPFEKFNKR
jgi:P27 family predicted phage terminase small subunit